MPEKPLTTRQLQAWANFTKALEHHGLARFCHFGEKGTDILASRLIVPCDREMEAAVQALATFGKDKAYLKSAHPGAYASYREKVTLFAMQITFLIRDGENLVDVDCDRGRPFLDVVGTVVHLGEVFWHWATKTETNPYPVCFAWKGRGIDIPLIPEESA